MDYFNGDDYDWDEPGVLPAEADLDQEYFIEMPVDAPPTTDQLVSSAWDNVFTTTLTGTPTLSTNATVGTWAGITRNNETTFSNETTITWR